MYEGKGYNDLSYQEVEAADGCPRGSINALKDGIVTRGILFDATLLPGKATADGWLEPGTVINYADLEALKKFRVSLSSQVMSFFCTPGVGSAERHWEPGLLRTALRDITPMWPFF